MRYIIYILPILFHVSCTSMQEQSNDALREDLTTKEKSLWEAWKTHNRNIWEPLTADDYLYVGDDGVKTRAEVSKDFAGDAVLEDYQILDSISCKQISPDAWILFYTAKVRGTIKGMPVERTEMEASVWVKRNGAKRVWLESNRRLTPALNLYRKLGFKEIPITVTPYARADIRMEIVFE